MDLAESTRIRANLPPKYWPFCVTTAMYLINRRPHSSLRNSITPYEAWWGRKPDLTHLRVLGCDAWAISPVPTRRAQDHHAERGIFVGYASGKKAYQLWNPTEQILIESRDTVFDEHSFKFWRTNDILNDVPQQPSYRIDSLINRHPALSDDTQWVRDEPENDSNDNLAINMTERSDLDEKSDEDKSSATNTEHSSDDDFSSIDNSDQSEIGTSVGNARPIRNRNPIEWWSYSHANTTTSVNTVDKHVIKEAIAHAQFSTSSVVDHNR
jgi:hypothetical protein